MKKVAIIRGKFLNSIEMLSYAGLLDEFEITAYATYNNGTNINEIPFPVKKLHCLEEVACLLPGKVRRYADFMFETVLGYNNCMFGLAKELKPFDIIQTLDNHLFFSLQAVRASERYGSKVIVTQWENIPFSRELSPLAKKVKREVNQKADAFVAITDRAKQALILEGVPSEKITVIPFGIDVDRFAVDTGSFMSRSQLSIEEDDVVVLFVGRLTYSKGLHHLAYAIKQLTEDPALRPRTIKLLIVGHGLKKNYIERLARKLGLEKHVVFADAVPNSQIQHVYKLSDIFVLPSIPTKYWQEQFGMVLVEAMAAGKPVVSTLSGSIPEVVGDSGLLVQPADHLSLYCALKKLILDKNLCARLGEKGRQRARSFFDKKRMVEKLRCIYQSL